MGARGDEEGVDGETEGAVGPPGASAAARGAEDELEEEKLEEEEPEDEELEEEEPEDEELEEAKEGGPGAEDAENRKPKRTWVAALAVKDVVDVGACAAAGGADREELSSANAVEEVEDRNATVREPNAPPRAARGGEGCCPIENVEVEGGGAESAAETPDPRSPSPFGLDAVASEPGGRSSSTEDTCAARDAAVFSHALPAAFAGARALANALTTDVWPFSAAKISAVAPISFAEFTSAPAPSNAPTTDA